MCGRYTLKKNPVEFLHKVFPEIQFDPAFAFTPSENVCPTMEVPVVLNANGTPFCTLLRWGLIPSWSREDKPVTGIINARSETVGEKPSFKASFRRKRCLVPADGFYEWKKAAAGSKKIPYRFFKKSDPFLLLAGIWDEWERPAGLLRTFTVLTTAANASVADVHDRMPVILDKNQANQWLSKNEDTSLFFRLFDPEKLPVLKCEEAKSY